MYMDICLHKLFILIIINIDCVITQLTPNCVENCIV